MLIYVNTTYCELLAKHMCQHRLELSDLQVALDVAFWPFTRRVVGRIA